MTVLVPIWTTIAVLSALIWMIRHALLSRVAAALPPLRVEASIAASTTAWPTLTVVVAAKDEERNIERCLRSLMNQQYPGLRIIAVNDRSTDATGDILDRLAADDVRLTAVHVRELRDGWFGKNNAMREGIARADSEWLLLTDADCTFDSPHSLMAGMAHAMEHRADFLSVLPVLDTQSLLEQIMQPACAGILLVWFNPMFVNDPRRRTAYANGAFMLMRRTAYEKMGGHEPVKAEVNEDIHMARRAKSLGLSLRVVGNEGVYRVRMYETFSQIWRGWSRIFYGCFGTPRRIALSMLLVALVGIQPWVSTALGWLLVRYTARPADWLPIAWTGTIAAALQLTLMIRYYRVAKIPAWLAPTYPFAACIALGMLTSALRRCGGRGTTTWRGTTYRGSQVT